MSGSNSSDASFAQAASRPLPHDGPDAAHLLELSVHSLPGTGEAVAALETRARQGRWKMLGVLLICAAPVVASYVTYYFVRPDARRSYGELIDPQRPVPDAVAARAADGTPAGTLGDLKGQWLLVSVAPGACDELCRSQLYLQRQLRESLGKEKDRLDRVWLVTDDAALPADITPGLAGAVVRRVDARAVAGWLAPSPGHTLQEHFFLVDPMGHWMMRFPARMDAAGAGRAKRDLDRLMRASSSWDQPGRPEAIRP